MPESQEPSTDPRLRAALADQRRLQAVRAAYGDYSWRDGDVMQAVQKMRKIGKVLEGARGP